MCVLQLKFLVLWIILVPKQRHPNESTVVRCHASRSGSLGTNGNWFNIPSSRTVHGIGLLMRHCGAAKDECCPLFTLQRTSQLFAFWCPPIVAPENHCIPTPPLDDSQTDTKSRSLIKISIRPSSTSPISQGRDFFSKGSRLRPPRRGSDGRREQNTLTIPNLFSGWSLREVVSGRMLETPNHQQSQPSKNHQSPSSGRASHHTILIYFLTGHKSILDASEWRTV
ncbi:conserved hypothetical protein [Coccidioides posadasii str. Silveira]|uniref:Secreted protein n=1 Tax=Coccidioides posadasii (strain RMSCC 757 / Silveira) TaxID=443226 RepID=E9D3I8_COCPS|nr:conserved hypothetical protein [Coccidioides posadasii str. Silveira]